MLHQAGHRRAGQRSPVLVVPGPYSEKELAYQAEDVAAGLTCNASFNCNATKVLMRPKGWARRGSFWPASSGALDSRADRRAYYPGARERWRAYTKGRSLRSFGCRGGLLPWTLVRIRADDREEPAFATEPFCPILFETEVAAPIRSSSWSAP